MTDKELLERIVIDPKVMLGNPVIKGTRLSVELILEHIAYGHINEELMRDYPFLVEEDIRAALLYAGKCLAHEEVYSNETIYRICSIHRFIETLVDRVLIFPYVSKWEDPAEGRVFKNLKKWKKELSIDWNIDNVCKGWYGSCWKIRQESDALWRCYSTYKFRVKLKVIKSEIYNILHNVNNLKNLKRGLNKNPLIMMDDIKYEDESKIKQDMDNIVNFRNYIYGAGSNDQIAESPSEIKPVAEDRAREAIFWGLTEKRRPFDYEKEFRMVIMTEDIGNILKINIPDINHLFKEVIFDPRASDEFYNSYKKNIKKLGYKGKIERSTLYHKIK